MLGGDGANYVYAYGIDNNWRDSFSDVVPDPTDLYLARVPKASIQNRSAWQFYAGLDAQGQPTWNADINQRKPVLTDTRWVYPVLNVEGIENMTVISQGCVVYNAPLQRYLYLSWTEYTFEFYEAPKPWGPWKLFMQKDFGPYPWFGRTTDAGCAGPKNGGYGTVAPSKFISADGKELWVNSNWFVNVACGPNNYNFSLRRLRIEPYVASTPQNQPDPNNNLPRTAPGTVPIDKTSHYGNIRYLNDGRTDLSEDSWDGTTKTEDWWGYTWPRQYTVDRVVYTTGQSFGDGSWFQSGLRVQVRRGTGTLPTWNDVTGLQVSPAYPNDNTAVPFKTYTFSFDAEATDGVRIVGVPGGSSSFTSISELAVYYDG